MPGLSIKPNLIHDITFSVVTPDDVAYTQGAARRGVFMTDSSAIVDTPAHLWRIRAPRLLQGDSSFAAKINRYHPEFVTPGSSGRSLCVYVADKSCGLRLGFFESLLIARHETARASIFELASMLNEARARKVGDLPSSRRKGIVRAAKG